MPPNTPRPPSSTPQNTLNTGPTLRSRQTATTEQPSGTATIVDDAKSARTWLSESNFIDPELPTSIPNLTDLLHTIAEKKLTIATYRCAMHATAYLISDNLNSLIKHAISAKLAEQTDSLSSILSESSAQILKEIRTLNKITIEKLNSMERLQSTPNPSRPSATMSFAKAVNNGRREPDPNKPRQIQRVINRVVAQAKNVVLVPDRDLENDPTENLNDTDLLTKGRFALSQLDSSDCPGDLDFTTVRKTKRSMIIYTCTNEAVAEWLKQPPNRSIFLANFSCLMQFLDTQCPILVEYVPVSFNPANPDILREVETSNLLDPGSLRLSRWIKPLARRTQNQRTAHLIINCATPEVANVAINSGLHILGRQLEARKLRPDPRRCLKCQELTNDHIAASCSSLHNVCGNCSEHHRTAQCPHPDQTHYKCANCQGLHGAWDRSCPIFVAASDKMLNRSPGLDSRLYLIPNDPATWADINNRPTYTNHPIAEPSRPSTPPVNSQSTPLFQPGASSPLIPESPIRPAVDDTSSPNVPSFVDMFPPMQPHLPNQLRQSTLDNFLPSQSQSRTTSRLSLQHE